MFVLDWLSADVLHFLHNAGILFHALLPGIRHSSGGGHGIVRLALLQPATKVAASVAALIGGVLAFLLAGTRGMASPGDISDALSKNPDLYTLSLGHMTDLTFQAFAYLRLPLALAIVRHVGGRGGRMVVSGADALTFRWPS